MSDDGYKVHEGMVHRIAGTVNSKTGEVHVTNVESMPLDDNVCSPHCQNLTGTGTAAKGNPVAYRAGWERIFGTKKPQQPQ